MLLASALPIIRIKDHPVNRKLDKLVGLSLLLLAVLAYAEPVFKLKFVTGSALVTL